MGVTGESGSEQGGQGGGRTFAGQEEKGRALGNRQPPTFNIQGVAAVGVDQLQGMKTEVGEPAQGIDPTDQDTVHSALAEHPQRKGNGHRPGRAGGRNRHCWTLASAEGGQILAQRVEAVMAISCFFPNLGAKLLLGSQNAAGGAAEQDRIRRRGFRFQDHANRFSGQSMGSWQVGRAGDRPDLADWKRASLEQRKDLKGGDAAIAPAEGFFRGLESPS